MYFPDTWILLRYRSSPPVTLGRDLGLFKLSHTVPDGDLSLQARIREAGGEVPQSFVRGSIVFPIFGQILDVL